MGLSARRALQWAKAGVYLRPGELLSQSLLQQLKNLRGVTHVQHNQPQYEEEVRRRNPQDIRCDTVPGDLRPIR